MIKQYKNNIYPLIFFILLILALYLVAVSRTICDDLDGIKRYGVLFLKGSHTPYTGKSLCIWDINEVVWYQGNYRDGLKEGLWTFYNIDSTKRSEINYREGKMNGVRKIYSTNNKIMTQMYCEEDSCKTINQAID